jgi:hypothetical protein
MGTRDTFTIDVLCPTGTLALAAVALIANEWMCKEFAPTDETLLAVEEHDCYTQLDEAVIAALANIGATGTVTHFVDDSPVTRWTISPSHATRERVKSQLVHDGEVDLTLAAALPDRLPFKALAVLSGTADELKHVQAGLEDDPNPFTDMRNISATYNAKTNELTVTALITFDEWRVAGGDNKREADEWLGEYALGLGKRSTLEVIR